MTRPARTAGAPSGQAGERRSSPGRCPAMGRSARPARPSRRQGSHRCPAGTARRSSSAPPGRPSSNGPARRPLAGGPAGSRRRRRARPNAGQVGRVDELGVLDPRPQAEAAAARRLERIEGGPNRGVADAVDLGRDARRPRPGPSLPPGAPARSPRCPGRRRSAGFDRARTARASPPSASRATRRRTASASQVVPVRPDRRPRIGRCAGRGSSAAIECLGPNRSVDPQRQLVPTSARLA